MPPQVSACKAGAIGNHDREQHQRGGITYQRRRYGPAGGVRRRSRRKAAARGVRTRCSRDAMAGHRGTAHRSHLQAAGVTTLSRLHAVELIFLVREVAFFRRRTAHRNFWNSRRRGIGTREQRGILVAVNQFPPRRLEYHSVGFEIRRNQNEVMRISVDNLRSSIPIVKTKHYVIVYDFEWIYRVIAAIEKNL